MCTYVHIRNSRVSVSKQLELMAVTVGNIYEERIRHDLLKKLSR